MFYNGVPSARASGSKSGNERASYFKFIKSVRKGPTRREGGCSMWVFMTLLYSPDIHVSMCTASL